MDYAKHYTKLVNKARNRIIDTYCEIHHILPKCMNGTDDPTNLVQLTPEEHYVAHQLLVKIYPNVPGLIYAAHMMSVTGGRRRYGWIKRKHAKMLSETRSGANHPMYGKPGTMTGRTHTDQAKTKMRKPKSEKARLNMAKKKGKENPLFGIQRSEEIKMKLRVPKPEGFGQGKNNSMFGRSHVEESKRLMSERAKKRFKLTCPHCSQCMAAPQARRYHFDNCKTLRKSA